MFESVGWLVVSILDVFLFSGPNSDRRTYEAYVAAYRTAAGRTSPGNLSLLREQFKQHSAPGAYAAPDGAPLASWIDSWIAGKTPRQARKKARSYHRDAG